VRETAALVGVALALPVLVHLLPAASVPWGARLLPMFYAPLLGVLLYRLHVGLIPAILAPGLNSLLTGSPALMLVPVLTVELTVFTIVAYALARRWRHHWPIVLVSFVLARAASALMMAVLPWLVEIRPVGALSTHAFLTGLPGLFALTLLAVVVGHQRMRPHGQV
jgi:hypothetical protein